MEQIKGYFFALLSAVLLGLMAVLVKIVLDMGLTTLSVIFLRFSLSSLFLAVFLRLRGVSFRLNRDQFFILLGVGVVGYGLMNVCYYGAFLLIPVGLTSMIHYIYPVVVVLLARLLYRSRFSKSVYAALILGMAGAMILSFSDLGRINLLGVLLAFLAGVCYGIYVVFMDHPKIKDLHGLVIVFYLSLFTA
ncbi:MAG: DMT family transporter, partial [Clostridia bacterium]